MVVSAAGRHARQQQSPQWETTTAASSLVAEEQEESVSPKAPIDFLPGLTEVIYPIDPKSQVSYDALQENKQEVLMKNDKHIFISIINSNYA